MNLILRVIDHIKAKLRGEVKVVSGNVRGRIYAKGEEVLGDRIKRAHGTATHRLHMKIIRANGDIEEKIVHG